MSLPLERQQRLYCNQIYVRILVCRQAKLQLFKEYLKFLNRLYDIIWFGAVYA